MLKRILSLGTVALTLTAITPAMAQMNTTQTTTMNDVASTPSEVKPLKVGDHVPSVDVTMPDGKSVDLKDVVSSAPTVLIFYRGGWCPYCNTHLGKLTTIEDKLKEAGYQIVAVSPDSPQFLAETLDKAKGHYQLLSDSDAKAIRAFGLAFKVDDATITRYEKYGIDLDKRSGKSDHILPVPAAYIVDKTGLIKYAFWTPDYKTRVNEQELLKTAESLSGN